MSYDTPSGLSGQGPISRDPNDRIASMPVLHFDRDAYTQFVADYDLSEKQKHELLEAMWGIVVAFVDLKFGGHPIQHALRATFKKSLTADSAAVVSSKKELPETINTKSCPAPERVAGKDDS